MLLLLGKDMLTDAAEVRWQVYIHSVLTHKPQQVRRDAAL